MARRVTSPTLIGRAGELAALAAAFRSAAGGSARLVLLAGDAGIGKTRLITEARFEGGLTAIGGCLQLGEVSVAYAPLVEALRSLRAQLGEDAFTAALGDESDDVRALLGATQAASSETSGPLFEHLLAFLSRLAAVRPVVLVIEDLHWADASTRDLVAFLARNLRDAAVLLVLSYRPDELHRRHPLRPVIADLQRYPHAERIALRGLDRDEVITLLGLICDAPPDVDGLIARSDGNPLYVEELVASGADVLPDSLSDAILSRVSRVSPHCQDVLRQAAVVGNDIDDTLLAALTGLPHDDVADALREAIGDQLLVVDAAGCRFRHALVREALYDDLLPGERERLHIRAAEAIEASDSIVDHVRWALLAHHWDVAREVTKALEASVHAASAAAGVHALADAAAQYERALTLFDRVPDAEQRIGVTRSALLLKAADAVLFSSASGRAVALAEAALDALPDDATPEERALVLERVGRTNWATRSPGPGFAAYEQAAALVADRPASRAKAFILAALGQSRMLKSMIPDAEPVLRDAINVARAVGAPDVEAHALCSLGPVLVEMGRVEEGLEVAYRALAESGEYGTIEDGCRAYINLVHDLYFAGRYEQAASVAADGLEYARRRGQLSLSGASIVGNWLAALIAAGQWTEAEELAVRTKAMSGIPYEQIRWLPLAIGRGRTDDAHEMVARLLDETANSAEVQFRVVVLRYAAELAQLDGALARARDMIALGIEVAAASNDCFYRPHVFALGLQVEADAVAAARGAAREADIDAARARADELIDVAHEFAASLVPLPEPRCWLATAEAEYARAWGRDLPAEWAGVVAAWEEIGQPYRAAQARLRQADALLRARGDRDEAAALAGRALEEAARLGARPLADAARDLAARGRLDLTMPATEPDDPLAPLKVTPRERDVLRLLAAGRTNREIGAELFISEKTASVHVTNLLRKLGVSSRVDAAVIAQRVGVR